MKKLILLFSLVSSCFAASMKISQFPNQNGTNDQDMFVVEDSTGNTNKSIKLWQVRNGVLRNDTGFILANLGSNVTQNLISRSIGIISGVTNNGGGMTFTTPSGDYNIGPYAFGFGASYDGTFEGYFRQFSLRGYGAGNALVFQVRDQPDTGGFFGYLDHFAARPHFRMGTSMDGTPGATIYPLVLANGNQATNTVLVIDTNGKIKTGTVFDGVFTPIEDLDVSSNVLVRGYIKAATGFITNLIMYGSPTATNFVNMQMSHLDVASGGTLTANAINFGSGTLNQNRGGTGSAGPFTDGSVIFQGSGNNFAEDVSNFSYNSTSKRLGVGISKASNTNSFAVWDNSAPVPVSFTFAGGPYRGAGAAGYARMQFNNLGPIFDGTQWVSELIDGTPSAQFVMMHLEMMSNGVMTAYMHCSRTGLVSQVPIYFGPTNMSAILANTVPNTRAITTSGSITGGGDMTADRNHTLVNDNATPGNLKYYGTDSGGTKGFFTLPSASGSSGSIVIQPFADGFFTGGVSSAVKLDSTSLGAGMAWDIDVDEEADYTIVIPADYTSTPSLKLVYWGLQNVATGNVLLSVKLRAYRNNTTPVNNSDSYTDVNTTTVVCAYNQTKTLTINLSNFPAISTGELLKIHIERIGSDPSDTYDGQFVVVGLAFNYVK